MYQVVVKKYIEVGIKKIRFQGSNDECVRWMSQHRWGYYDLLAPNGQLCSYMLRDQ